MSKSLPTQVVHKMELQHPQDHTIDCRSKIVPTILRSGHDYLYATPSLYSSSQTQYQSLSPPPLIRQSSDPSSNSFSDPSRYSRSASIPLSNNLSLPDLLCTLEIASDGGDATSGDTKKANAHPELPLIKLTRKQPAIRIDNNLSNGGWHSIFFSGNQCIIRTSSVTMYVNQQTLVNGVNTALDRLQFGTGAYLRQIQILLTSILLWLLE